MIANNLDLLATVAGSSHSSVLHPPIDPGRVLPCWLLPDVLFDALLPAGSSRWHPAGTRFFDLRGSGKEQP